MNKVLTELANSREIFGTEEPPLQEKEFRAGDFQIDLSGGQIGRISWRGTEVLRGVTYLVRDKDWATPTCTVTQEPCETGEVFRLRGKVDEQNNALTYQLTVRISDKGELRIQTEGRSLAPFVANRVGLTLLHPVPECCGRALEIEHSNGEVEHSKFPVNIMPSQPVFDIACLNHSLDRCQVNISFSATRPGGRAEYFEMEDQRNWGDASYKTYIGSLRDPWPFHVATGDTFSQSVSITAQEVKAAPPIARGSDPINSPSETLPKTPEIAVAVPLRGAKKALENIKNYGVFKPSRISAYLRSDRLDAGELEALAELAHRVQCPLGIELEVHGDPCAALAMTAKACTSAAISPHSVLALPAEYTHSYQPDGEWPDVTPLNEFYELVRLEFGSSRIGGGMLTYFTELNRKWPPIDAIDYVAHAYCPIVHAADDTTVLQNLETLPLIAQTVRHHAPNLQYEIVSALISMRQNPYGEAPVSNPHRKRLPMAASDPRETAQFGGLWILAVARQLAKSHASLLTVGALSGPASIYALEMPDGKLPTYFAIEHLIKMQGMNFGDAQTAEQELMARHFADAQPLFALVLGKG